MTTYREFCRLRDLHLPGANAPKHTEADAFFMAAAQLAVPEGYKLVPLEPTPEIIDGAAVASWPTASPADISLARLAAQGQEAENATKAIYWLDCLYKCAKLLELSDDTPIPSGVVDAVEKLVAVRMPPRAAIKEQEDSLRYPATMTTALADVLSLMNFRTGPMARVYRAAGAEIRTKCEDEQAFILDRFLRLALEHGDNWRTAAEADLKAAHTLAEANKAEKS